MSYAIVALSIAAGVTIDLNIAAVLGAIATIAAGTPSYLVVRANRRKVIEETGDTADGRIERIAELWRKDNIELRAHIVRLEGRLDAAEARCDLFERTLVQHGIPVPTPA